MHLSCFPLNPESKAYSGFGSLTCQWITNESFLLAYALLINHLLLKLYLTQFWGQWHCVSWYEASCTIAVQYVYVCAYISFLCKWQWKPQAYKTLKIFPRPCVFSNWVWRNHVKEKQTVIVSNMYEVAKQTVFVDASKGKCSFFLHFSSANPSRPLFLSRFDPILKAFVCFAVPWMQRELVWRDWAVGDWVWNGPGQPQGIWTGLMDLFETCRGYEQWGWPWGHVYSELSRACRMPIHFPSNLSKCSTTYGCHWALSLGGKGT